MQTSLFYYALSLFLVSIPVFSHPGGLDANGGHFNRKTGQYHYHRGGPAKASTAPAKPRAQPSIAPAPSSALAAAPTTSSTKPQASSISDTALKRLVERAEAGETAAQYQLAERYLKGDGVPKDEAKAREWFTKSAQGGSMWAAKRLEALNSTNAAPAVSSPSPVPAASSRDNIQSVARPAIAEKYWITSSTSKRHNSKCRYYQNSSGRPAESDEGIACKICGG